MTFEHATNKKVKIVLLIIALLLLAVGLYLFINKKTSPNIKDDTIADENKIINNSRQVSENDHILGKIDSPVKIIFYSDYDCPFSASFYETLKKAREEFNENFSVVLRHFPMRTHVMAYAAAISAECAGEQGKFWEMTQKLFDDKKNERMSTEQFISDAKEIGLNADLYNKCVETEKFKEKIQADWQGGKDANIIGTPGCFINGEQLSGAIPYDNFKDQNGDEQEGLRGIINRLLKK